MMLRPMIRLVFLAVLAGGPLSVCQAETPSGTTSSDSPKEVVLTFDVPVTRDQVDAAVISPDGQIVASAKSEGVTVNGSTLTIPLPPLKPGVYQVAWSCRYGAGQVSEGKYTITVHATHTF